MLGDDAFVFLMHQGYQFSFFHTGAGDDPPVFHYHEGHGEEVRAADTLSGFLLLCVTDHEQPRNG